MMTMMGGSQGWSVSQLGRSGGGGSFHRSGLQQSVGSSCLGDLAIWWLLLLTILSPFSPPRQQKCWQHCQDTRIWSIVWSGYYVSSEPTPTPMGLAQRSSFFCLEVQMVQSSCGLTSL